MRRLALSCAGIALCATGATQLFAATPDTIAATRATDYIRTLQNTDGGFPDFAATSSPGATIDAVFAFAATGVDPKTVTRAGAAPDDYLSAQAATYSGSAGGAANLVLAVATLDLDPASFGGINASAIMESNYEADAVLVPGKYGNNLFAQSLFMLAKAALGQPVPEASADYLQSLQQLDGGWEYSSGWGTDTNTASLAIRALIAAGVPAADPDISEAIVFLHSSQQPDGGFPYSDPCWPDFDPADPCPSDPNSTAYVIQAIVAAGQSLDADGPWDAGGGKTPLTALLAFQNPDTGALQYFGTDSPLATYQGVPGLMLSAYPEQQVYGPASTATATATSSPTATATATPSATATRTRTPTATRTSIPSATAAATGTPISTVAGAVATRTGVSAAAGAVRLPNTGGGPGDASAHGIALLLAGGTILIGTGASLRRSRRGCDA